MSKKTLMLILDGQGGGVGRKIAERLLAEQLNMEYLVIGSNALATANMMKSGITAGATGENAWIYNCSKADIIIGPIGIAFANSMNGEVSPKMAQAVVESNAKRVLIPFSYRHIAIVGLAKLNFSQYLDEMLLYIKE